MLTCAEALAPNTTCMSMDLNRKGLNDEAGLGFCAANLPANIVDFRGFDSSIILI